VKVDVKKDGKGRTVRHRFATTLLAVKTAESATHPTIASASKTTLRATTADATVCVLTVSKVPPLPSPSFASPSPSAAVCNSTSRRRRERSSSKDELLNTMGRLFIKGNIFIEITNLLRDTIGQLAVLN